MTPNSPLTIRAHGELVKSLSSQRPLKRKMAALRGIKAELILAFAKEKGASEEERLIDRRLSLQ